MAMHLINTSQCAYDPRRVERRLENVALTPTAAVCMLEVIGNSAFTATF